MKSYLSWYIAIIFALLVTTNATADSYQDAIDNWTKVLQAFVDEQGRIDFNALANNRTELDSYVEYIKTTSPTSHPDLFPTVADQLAYHINSYNALAMQGVIDEQITDGFNGFFKRAAFFKFHNVTIGGGKTSLYDYENKVIRSYGEPRIHFALNCMLKDCPRLPREPFQAKLIDNQLDATAKEFFNKDTHIKIDVEKEILWLSEILDFYTKDFIGKQKSKALIGYVNQYRDEKIPEDYRVRFIKYDWSLNQQPD